MSVKEWEVLRKNMKWKKVGGGDFWERNIFLFWFRFEEEGLDDIFSELLGARKNEK